MKKCFLLFLLSGCTIFQWTVKKDGVWHKVEKGQTLWRIAKTYNVDIQVIADANNIEDITKIRAGDRLFIPGAKEVLEVEPYRPERRFSWPIKGKITSYFGRRGLKFHKGIDIAEREGAKIRASADGVVTFSEFCRTYGNLIIIAHKDHFSTLYAHNKKNLVEKGDRVKEGDVIALLGSTGRSTGPHLHFEIRYRGKAENPLIYLERPRE